MHAYFTSQHLRIEDSSVFNRLFVIVIVGHMVRSRVAMGAFDEFSRAKKIVRGQTECLLGDQEPLALKAYLSPSVLVATALEKFTIYTSQAKGRTRTYSILFRIKKILKYERGTNASNLLPISDQYSSEINFKSLIMIENFNEQDTSCHGIHIKPDSDYILFLSAQNTSINANKRKQLTYPVRLGILTNQSMSKRYTKRYSKSSIFVRMPVFSKFAKPIVYKSALDRELNSARASPLKLTMARPQVQNGTLHLECSSNANSLTSVLWLKSGQSEHVHLNDSQKYRIHLSNFKSILEVKNFSHTDKATYTCFTFDYPNGNIFNEKVIHDEANVTKELIDESMSKFNSDKEKKFISCGEDENGCINGGQCLKTNPMYYKNSHLYHLIKTKFCLCKEFYEGPNCEFELLRRIQFDSNEIPDDLKPLWDSLSAIKTP